MKDHVAYFAYLFRFKDTYVKGERDISKLLKIHSAYYQHNTQSEFLVVSSLTECD